MKVLISAAPGIPPAQGGPTDRAGHERSRRCRRGPVSGADTDQVILGSMTHRVGPKGQVVIPKELRDRLGIEPGDEVDFWLDDDHVAVRLVEHRRPLRGRFHGSPLTSELQRERAADRRREASR